MVVTVEEDLNIGLVAVEELHKGELCVGGPDLEGVAQLPPHHVAAQLGVVVGRRAPQ